MLVSYSLSKVTDWYYTHIFLDCKQSLSVSTHHNKRIQKTPQMWRFLMAILSILRVLYLDYNLDDSYVSRRTIADTLTRLKFTQLSESTVLHRGKGLAVSPLVLLPRLFATHLLLDEQEIRAFRHKTSLFAPRGLLLTGVTCYLLRVQRTRLSPDVPHPHKYRSVCTGATIQQYCHVPSYPTYANIPVRTSNYFPSTI